MIVTVEGKPYNFPDDATDEEINEYFESEKPKKSKGVTRDIPDKESLVTRGFNNLRLGMAANVAGVQGIGAKFDRAMGGNPSASENYEENIPNILAGRYPDGQEGIIPSLAFGALTDPATLATIPIGGPAFSAGKGFITPMLKAGYQGLKEGVVSAGIHQAENAGKGEASLTGGLTEVGASTFGMPAMSALGKGLGLVKSAGGAMADAFRKVSSMGGTGEKTVTKSGFQLTPGQMNPTRATQSIEFEAQANPFLADIPEKMGMENRSLFNQMMAGNIKEIPSATGFDNVPSVTGKRLEDALRQSKQGVTESYKQGSGQSLDQISGLQIPMVDGMPKVQQEVAEILNKYTYGPEGSARIGSEAINLISKTGENLKQYTNPKDLLNLKRNFGGEIYLGKKGERPLFTGADEVAFGEVYKAIDNAISESFDQLGDNEKIYKELWQATNKKYATGRTALEAIENSLGATNLKVKPEDYMKRINGIGANKLQELKQLSMDDPDLKPVFEEIQGAFFDNFLNRVSNKSKDDISFDKIISEWNGMDAGTKEAMMPKKVIENMNEIVSVLSKQKGFGMWAQNPSGTASATIGSNVLKNPKEWVMSMIMRGPVQDYYQKGHVDALRTSYQLSKNFDKVTKFADDLATKSMFKGLVKNYDKMNPGVYHYVRAGVRAEAFGQ